MQTFFGELQRIVRISLLATPYLNLENPGTLFLVIVRQCNMTQSRGGFWEYATLDGLEVVDLSLVQCVIGRIFN